MTQAHYTVLARRFRPQTFADVVGQGHVGQALRNAIQAGRVAHAYLFTGARGVGKTSTARIFAKALNCPHAVDAVPCNQCDTCQGISAGSDVDVLEIDGASNRGIDDIRQLRANVNVKSMRSRFKVYIIDEVHMLTKEAFNALLKTLEEPPPNVKFVFCTTEPNKVPDTILSRCQRFDFGTIATSEISLRLHQIAEAEGMQVDAEAIELVARRAAGSMRDSQSLFDQLLAFGEDHVTTEDVHRLLGTAPDERLIDLFEGLIDRRRAEVLSQLNDALQQGVQLGPFSDQLLEYLRDLLIVLVGAGEVPLSSLGESWRETLLQQGTRWGLQTITAAMQILAETKGRMQRGNYGRALLELALIRISLLEDLDELARLARQLAGGGPPAGGPPANIPTAATPSRKAAAIPGAPTGTATEGRRSDALRHRLQSVSPPPASGGISQTADDSEDRGPSPSGAETGVGRETRTKSVERFGESGPTTMCSSATAAAPAHSPDREESRLGGTMPGVFARETANIPGEFASAPGATSVPHSETNVSRKPALSGRATETLPAPAAEELFAPQGSPESSSASEHRSTLVGDADGIWAQIIQQVPDTLAAHLKNAHNLAISGPNLLEVRFPQSYVFSMNYCQRPETLKQLTKLAGQVAGSEIEIRLYADSSGSGGKTVPSRGKRSDEGRLRPKVVEKDQFVQKALTIFGGTVVDVRKVLDLPPDDSATQVTDASSDELVDLDED